MVPFSCCASLRDLDENLPAKAELMRPKNNASGRFSRYSIQCCIFLCPFLLSFSLKGEEVSEKQKFRDCSLRAGFNFGKFISIENNYVDVEAFLPVLKDEKSAFFLDAWGYWFDQGEWAFNTGIGARRCIYDEHVIGLNVYYDFLKGPFDAHLNRMGIGGEWFFEGAEFRINAYLPVWKSSYSGRFCFFDLGDGFLASTTQNVSAYSGFDASFGGVVWQPRDFDLFFSLGPYYFHKHCLPSFWGGSLHVQLDWRSLCFLGARMSVDQIYRFQVQGMLEISIPLDFIFSKKEGSICSRNLNQKIQRNGIILTRKYCDWEWNWDDE